MALPYEAVQRMIAESLDIVAHLVRRPDGRRVLAELVRLEGLTARADGFRLRSFDKQSRNETRSRNDEPP